MRWGGEETSAPADALLTADAGTLAPLCGQDVGFLAFWLRRRRYRCNSVCTRTLLTVSTGATGHTPARTPTPGRSRVHPPGGPRDAPASPTHQPGGVRARSGQPGRCAAGQRTGPSRRGLHATSCPYASESRFVDRTWPQPAHRYRWLIWLPRMCSATGFTCCCGQLGRVGRPVAAVPQGQAPGRRMWKQGSSAWPRRASTRRRRHSRPAPGEASWREAGIRPAQGRQGTHHALPGVPGCQDPGTPEGRPSAGSHPAVEGTPHGHHEAGDRGAYAPHSQSPGDEPRRRRDQGLVLEPALLEEGSDGGRRR